MNPSFATQFGLNEHEKDKADDQTAAGKKVKTVLVSVTGYSWGP